MEMGTVSLLLSSIALPPCLEGLCGVVFPSNINKLKNEISKDLSKHIPSNAIKPETSKSGNVDHILTAVTRKRRYIFWYKHYFSLSTVTPQHLSFV